MKYLVTSALPYANGRLHIGHIAGAYLPADIFVRWLKLHKEDVVYICGTDEHGTPISIAADKEGVSPQELVQRYHEAIKNAFDAMEIEFDNFSGTARPGHYKLSQEFFLTLYNKGHILPRKTKQFYCETDHRFLPDRYVEGICPRCNATGARGDQCEACGQIYETTTLIEPRCKICGNTPIIKETTHWYFQLNNFKTQLTDWIGKKDYWKENVRNFMLNLLEQGLVERPITRDLNWGVPVPLEDTEGKVLYVWFEAPIGYISSTQEWAEKIGNPERWKDYWLDPETRLIHFIGKDNIIFHALIWPAMLMGQDKTYCLPYDIPANEFMNLEGKKISTSKNWAIWIDEFVEKFPAEYLRYYLACIAPEKNDSDFSFSEFQQKVNRELNDVLGNLANRVFTLINKHFDGYIKPIELTDNSKKVLEEAQSLYRQIDEGYKNYQVKWNAKLTMDLARLGNRYFDERKPWAEIKNNPLSVQETLYVCLTILHLVSVALYPVMPKSMNKLRKMMGLEAVSEWENIDLNIEYKLEKIEPLFFKLDDSIIEDEIQRLKQNAKLNSSKINQIPIKEFISYDEFAKVDIRVATILSAQKVPKTDKLLHLKVDIGNEERELIAGIAEHYKPENLPGKQVLMLVNLEPRTIRGIKSQGMILAIESEDNLILVVPEKYTPPGSVVK
ncbi:MAG: methionine--tRNA ligase [Candidatus Cloacimonadaceae bacterium]|nr:methionine--tRNA ligase [Candidatus Cloacimonadota bacterium]